ncbi:MAG: D-glycero-beta-D-manno-heptose 1,7-bisphosphate 7-phosphatase [Gammaproteobacteria bacterium]|uniref:D-glycero-beta-D-manno-heptose 1,7-bisphosphate 7-phosphatase n=1 Tax=Algiphilus sp. TaxID=1872431 RepID=UPI0032EE409C
MRALLLDRDGVINHDSPDFIRSVEDFLPLPGALDAIVRAERAGFRVIVVSNQSGLARGLLGMRELNAIHRRLQDELERMGARIEAFFFCPHGPDDGCDCRKPAGGLLRTLAVRLGIDLAATPFVGDRVTDAAAARSVGARPLLVRTGLAPLDPAALAALGAIETFDDLGAAVDALLAC